MTDCATNASSVISPDLTQSKPISLPTLQQNIMKLNVCDISKTEKQQGRTSVFNSAPMYEKQFLCLKFPGLRPSLLSLRLIL